MRCQLFFYCTFAAILSRFCSTYCVKPIICNSLTRSDEVFPTFFSGRCMFRLVRNEALRVTNVLWQEKYIEAMLEFDQRELSAKIAAAKEAIDQRIGELNRSDEDSEEELRALSDALRGLHVLAQAEGQGSRSSMLDKQQRQEAS